MKIYFDDVTKITSSNCEPLSRNGLNDFWLTSPGTRLKQELKSLGIPFYKLDELDEPGLYFVEVNGDPQWWCGLCKSENGPDHILTRLPNKIIKLVRRKQLRLVISADREGGGMIHNGRDGFQTTTDAIKALDIPIGSVIIIQGNLKIEQQYRDWLKETGNEKLFDVKYSNHFSRIFVDNTLPIDKPLIYKVIQNESAKDFNSLNRTYKTHRHAHLYTLAVQNLLGYGLVSANEIKVHDKSPLELMGLLHNKTDEECTNLQRHFDDIMSTTYPLFVDGDWSVNNAANNVNLDIYKNTLISFVTETKFDEDVIFLTEKVYKCLTVGHPMIVLGPCGTLQALEDLGYNTNFCGIDTSYNTIPDHTERFYKTHEVLVNWINLPREEKLKRLQDSIPAIEHNFKLSIARHFYQENLLDTINISKDYFND